MANTIVRRCAAIVIALAMLASCTSHHHRTRTVPAAIPGEIVVAYPWEPATFNPFVVPGDEPATRELTRPLYPELFRTLADGSTQPSLIDHVVDESPLRIDAVLRSDATWSDGVPISVADVIFTWHTIMDTRWHIASRTGYDAISSIDEPHPHELRVTFNRAMKTWRSLFSNGLGVLPAHALTGKDFNRSLGTSWPVSGGPFVLSTYVRGLEMVFDANPRAWGAHPLAKRIRIQFVPDPTTAFQLYRAGKVDVLGPYSTSDFARRLKSEANIAVFAAQGTLQEVLSINTDQLPDATQRTAVIAAINRDALVAGLVRAEGTRVPDTIPYAPDRNALASLGPASRSLAVVGNDEISVRLARAIYYELHSQGVDLNLVDLEYEQQWGYWLESNRFNLAIVREFAGQRAAPHSLDLPLYRVTVSVGARTVINGVQANANPDGLLESIARWSRTS